MASNDPQKHCDGRTPERVFVEGQPAYGMPPQIRKPIEKTIGFFVEALEGHPLIPMMLHVTQASKPQKLNRKSRISRHISPCKMFQQLLLAAGPNMLGRKFMNIPVLCWSSSSQDQDYNINTKSKCIQATKGNMTFWLIVEAIPMSTAPRPPQASCERFVANPPKLSERKLRRGKKTNEHSRNLGRYQITNRS